MKYLCLCYYDTAKLAALSPEQLAEIGPNCKPHDEVLKATGKVVVHASLVSPEQWKTIRPVNGAPIVSPGPLSEATQTAGAFFIVDANSVDEAVEVASKHAAANYGDHVGMAVEVRECASYD
jgi:hypothetical protein